MHSTNTTNQVIFFCCDICPSLFEYITPCASSRVIAIVIYISGISTNVFVKCCIFIYFLLHVHGRPSLCGPHIVGGPRRGSQSDGIVLQSPQSGASRGTPTFGVGLAKRAQEQPPAASLGLPSIAGARGGGSRSDPPLVGWALCGQLRKGGK